MESYSSWAKRAPWIENDHITCFQIASLNGIRVRPACVLYCAEEIKWQNKPIFGPQCIHAGGPHCWEKQLKIKYCFDSRHAALGLWSGWNLLSYITGHFNGMEWVEGENGILPFALWDNNIAHQIQIVVVEQSVMKMMSSRRKSST